MQFVVPSTLGGTTENGPFRRVMHGFKTWPVEMHVDYVKLLKNVPVLWAGRSRGSATNLLLVKANFARCTELRKSLCKSC